MSEPDSIEQYNARYHKNVRFEGYGLEVRTVLPCPFCAAPDFLVFPVTAGLSDYKEVQEETKCKECNRSGRNVITKDQHGSIRMEFVQTAGNDPPKWFPFKIRRVTK